MQKKPKQKYKPNCIRAPQMLQGAPRLLVCYPKNSDGKTLLESSIFLLGFIDKNECLWRDRGKKPNGKNRTQLNPAVSTRSLASSYYFATGKKYALESCRVMKTLLGLCWAYAYQKTQAWPNALDSGKGLSAAWVSVRCMQNIR